MTKNRFGAPGGGPLTGSRRKPVSFPLDDLVETTLLDPEKGLPLIVQPKVDGISLRDWAAGNVGFLTAKLHQHGALLFRRFTVKAPADFEGFITVVSGELMEYRERSSPRHLVSGRVYTSTDYPADQSIFLHNEHSYSLTYPQKIFFFCATPAAEGGETPIADCRRVLMRIDPQVRNKFIEKGWMYVRNYGEGFGLPWQVVFQTRDRSAVEEYCRGKHIQFEWRERDRLRTRQVRPVLATHPDTGEMSWFNHATFFHFSTLEPTLRSVLLAQFEEEDLPNNTYYGDGSPIEPVVMERLRDDYMQEEVCFSWRAGDVLMLDNMLVAHSRRSYRGKREVLVGMSDPRTTLYEE